MNLWNNKMSSSFLQSLLLPSPLTSPVYTDRKFHADITIYFYLPPLTFPSEIMNEQI